MPHVKSSGSKEPEAVRTAVRILDMPTKHMHLERNGLRKDMVETILYMSYDHKYEISLINTP
jgi:hypothetical protein